MKLFWKIIASLYSDLKMSGIKLPTYSFLFNKPKMNFDTTIIELVSGDVSFDDRERALILEAANDMYRFTNKRILFNITFDLESGDNINNKNVIIKSTSDQEHVQKADERHDNPVIGLCYYRDDNTKSIHMITDRLLYSDEIFRTTVIHEMGHYLDMTHTNEPSIMQPIISHVVAYPTYIDAVELARVWNCLPSELGYFKL